MKQAVFLALFLMLVFATPAMADRTSDFVIYGKIKSLNLEKGEVEIINGERTRTFHFYENFSYIVYGQNKLALAELIPGSIIELVFWHDGESGRSNVISSISLIKEPKQSGTQQSLR